MIVKISCGLVGLIWLFQLVGLQLAGPHLAQDGLQRSTDNKRFAPGATQFLETLPGYSKDLQFNVYKFSVMAADSGAVRDLTVKAYRGELLLTTFRIRVDGAIVGAEVADLDNNRFPELYVYSTSNGSGSFGRVYAWQFLPERKADVTPMNWRLPATDGYMGHDSLWVERNILCRKYPVYLPGDANAEPSGGIQMKRYRLQQAGASYQLIAE